MSDANLCIAAKMPKENPVSLPDTFHHPSKDNGQASSSGSSSPAISKVGGMRVLVRWEQRGALQPN